jgi:hypothetical protein
MLRGSFTYMRNVPGPVVGAGIPGILAACMTMVGLQRRRCTKTSAAA